MSLSPNLMPNTTDFADGEIALDSDFGKEIGFTSDKFQGGPFPSYLWKDGKRIWISTIFSVDEGKGNLSYLFNEIEKRGFEVAVPTPSRHMTSILMRKGFRYYIDKDNGCEIWVKSLTGQTD